MIQLSGRQAHAVAAMEFVDFAPLVGPQDGIVVITHTAETAFALSTRAQAFSAGLGPVMITKRGSGFPDAIETVEKETSDTYTVSYTTAVLALALLAKELGAESLDDAVLQPRAGSGRLGDRGSSIDAIVQPERVLVFVGAGPSAVTAREGALKVREASRFLAEGYDAEYLLHGSAVPLDGRDRVVALFPPDPSGLVEAIANAAESEKVPVTRLTEPADLPQTLAQLPLTVRLQLLALRFAQERSQNPDTVIVGGLERSGDVGDRRSLATNGHPSGPNELPDGRQFPLADQRPHDGPFAVGLGAQDLGLPIQPRRDVLAAPRHQQRHLERRMRDGVADDLEQPLGALAGERRDRDRAREAPRQPRPRRARDLVDLVEREDLGDVSRSDLAQHPAHGLDLLVQLRRCRVGDVQDHVGVGHLLERGSERLDQIVGQLAHEPDGVRQRRPTPARQLELAGGRVERREQLIGHQRVRAREAIEQRRLTGVRVARRSRPA